MARTPLPGEYQAMNLQAPPSVTWRTHLSLALLALVYIFSYIDRQVIAILIEPIKQEFSASDSQMGMLTGLAFGLLYAALGVPVGKLADRYNRRAIVAVACALWSLATMACGAEVFAHAMDLMDSASMDTALDAVLAHFGRIDLLINNAVYQDREINAMLLDLDDAALQRTLVGNVVAPFHLARRLLPTLLAQGSGQIINVCSGAGEKDPPVPANQGGWGFAYGASKGALARLAGCINREHGTQGVHAYSVNPGLVSTEAVTATLGDGSALAQRYGAMAPAAIGASLLWLATDLGGASVGAQAATDPAARLGT